MASKKSERVWIVIEMVKERHEGQDRWWPKSSDAGICDNEEEARKLKAKWEAEGKWCRILPPGE